MNTATWAAQTAMQIVEGGVRTASATAGKVAGTAAGEEAGREWMVVRSVCAVYVYMCMLVWRGVARRRGECKGIKMWIKYLQARCFCFLPATPTAVSRKQKQCACMYPYMGCRTGAATVVAGNTSSGGHRGCCRGGVVGSGCQCLCYCEQRGGHVNQPGRLGVVDARGKVLIVLVKRGRQAWSVVAYLPLPLVPSR